MAQKVLSTSYLLLYTSYPLIRDAMAVVDPELRVHEITGRRVADAARMLTVVSGHTNAATIMIGERVANLVRETLRLAA